jgi:hypothetical protein
MAVPHSKINIDMQDNLDLLETAILKYARGQKLKKKQQILFEEWTARSESHRQLPELFKDPRGCGRTCAGCTKFQPHRCGKKLKN